MSGLWIPARRKVPLPAIDRRVSGRRRRIKRRAMAPRPKRNQNIERKPKY